MTNHNDLAEKTCEPCRGGMAAMDKATAQAMMQDLHADWQLSDDATSLTRRLELKGLRQTCLPRQSGPHGWATAKTTTRILRLVGAIVRLYSQPTSRTGYRRMISSVRRSLIGCWRLDERRDKVGVAKRSGCATL